MCIRTVNIVYVINIKGMIKMKYVVMLGDGMADLPMKELSGKTPLEVADKPCMNRLASLGIMGMARTVYEGMKPGSDVANLCVMGFNPLECYTGRSPLEAASIGVELSDKDITYRANLVTLSDEEAYEDKSMVDYSAGEISTAEAEELISELKAELDSEFFSFYAGVSYRHLLLRKNEKKAGELIPPHDISGKPVKEYLPKDPEILELMKKSSYILRKSKINEKRIAEGKNPATSLWIWGEGTRPVLKSYEAAYNLKGAVISAVDLIKGIGRLSGMKVIEVPGVTGNVHTNFKGKKDAAIKCLSEGCDYVYIHVEAPDESGHQRSLADKIKSIELIDSEILAPVYDYLKESGEEFRILCMPDHPTPIYTGTHSAEPVPFFVVTDKDCEIKKSVVYCEREAENTGIYIDCAHTLTDKLIKGF